MYCVVIYMLCIQIRDELPELKAIVQYKGKLSQEYSNVYDVSLFGNTPEADEFSFI